MNVKKKVNWFLLLLVLILSLSTIGVSVYSWFFRLDNHKQGSKQLENIASQYSEYLNNYYLMMDTELKNVVSLHMSELKALDTNNPKDLAKLEDLVDYQFRKDTQYRFYFGAVTADRTLVGYLYKTPGETHSNLSTILEMSDDKTVFSGISFKDASIYLHRANKQALVGAVMPIISADMMELMLMQIATRPPTNQNASDAASLADYEILILDATGTNGIQISYEGTLNTRVGEASDDALLIGKNIIDHTLADDSILYAVSPLKDDVGHVVVYTLKKASSN